MRWPGAEVFWVRVLVGLAPHLIAFEIPLAWPALSRRRAALNCVHWPSRNLGAAERCALFAILALHMLAFASTFLLALQPPSLGGASMESEDEDEEAGEPPGPHYELRGPASHTLVNFTPPGCFTATSAFLLTSLLTTPSNLRAITLSTSQAPADATDTHAPSTPLRV